MHSIRRSCQSAFRSPSEVLVFANGSKRAFSRSHARSRGALPVFLQASSPELSTLLSTLNSKILLPKHLTKEQEKLVYKKENKAKLEAEPVEITLGEVTIPLEPIDRNHLPDRWATFRDIVSKSESRDDWENVVRLLEGFENAGIKVNKKWQQLVVRHLNLSGNQHLILKALQRAKATGLRMRDSRVVIQVLRSVHDMAALSDWDKDETIKALRFARQVVEMLEDEEHHPAQTDTTTPGYKTDYRGDPGVIALPTELAAVLADRHGGDVEEVKTMAGRLMASLKQDNYSSTLDTFTTRFALKASDFPGSASQSKHVMKVVTDVLPLLFVWNALKTSRKVLGGDMPEAEQAQELEERTHKLLTEGLANAESLRVRDGQEYKNGLVEYTQDAVRRCG